MRIELSEQAYNIILSALLEHRQTLEDDYHVAFLEGEHDAMAELLKEIEEIDNAAEELKHGHK